MSKIYIVTSGSYSDYHICSVFSTKKDANGFVGSFAKDKYDNFRVEEYELDEFKDQIKNHRSLYFVRMKENGDTLEIEKRSTFYRDGCCENMFDVEKNLIMEVWADDEKHAVKIVNEKRVQLIAENKWGKNKIGK